MTHESDRQLVRNLAEFYGQSPSALAKKAGLATTTLTRPLNHEIGHELSARTLRTLKATFPDFPGFAGHDSGELGDASAHAIALFYKANGDTSEAAPGAPAPDFLAQALGIDTQYLFSMVMRGNHMEPEFRDGDKLVIDRRFCEPIRPGPFCLSDGDGYTIKFVEKIPTRKNIWRIFSADPRFTAFEAKPEEIEIVGRPILMARDL